MINANGGRTTIIIALDSILLEKPLAIMLGVCCHKYSCTKTASNYC
jgi:hypothetical protein